jgi:hypothetical protein
MLPTSGMGSSGSIPDYVKMFGQVFSEEGFAKLPNRKPWDHAIELVPGAQPKGCKVYLLSVKEQAELDVFLTKNLETGRIQQSKSPMALPVFFIKKKDGSLWLVQDYRMLNEMMVKNKYLLPSVHQRLLPPRSPSLQFYSERPGVEVGHIRSYRLPEVKRSHHFRSRVDDFC